MTKRITINVETQKIYADEGGSPYTTHALREQCSSAPHWQTQATPAGGEVTEEIGANLIAEIGRQLDEQKQGPPPWRKNT